MNNKNYYNKHWRLIEKCRYDLSRMPRKTKKAAKVLFELIGQPTEEDIQRWEFDKFPDCQWCNGSGTYREHYNDTGYGCPDCYGSGKTGWEHKDRP